MLSCTRELGNLPLILCFAVWTCKDIRHLSELHFCFGWQRILHPASHQSIPFSPVFIIQLSEEWKIDNVVWVEANSPEAPKTYKIL